MWSVIVDGNLYVRIIDLIDHNRYSLEVNELVTGGLLPPEAHTLAPHKLRMLVELLAQLVRPHFPVGLSMISSA